MLVSESCADIKRVAREKLRGFWLNSILVFIAFGLVFVVLLFLLLSPFLYSLWKNGGRSVDVGSSLFIFCLFVAFLLQLSSAAFIFSFSSFMLSLFRNGKIDLSSILSGFRYCFKTFRLFFVRQLAIFSLSTLFVPGIIASYSYSQALYILIDNPKRGVWRCIQESREMMKGNKIRCFSLYLSFIGWLAACSLLWPICISLFSIASNPLAYVLAALFCCFASIPVFALLVYMEASAAAFYEIAAGNFERGAAARIKDFVGDRFDRFEAIKSNLKSGKDLNAPRLLKTTSKLAESPSNEEEEPFETSPSSGKNLGEKNLILSRLLKTTSKSVESPSNEEKEPFETSLSSGENQGEKNLILSRLLKTTSKSAESPSNEEKEPFETSLSSGENQGEKNLILSRLLKTTSKLAESPSNEEKEPFETSLSSGKNLGEKNLILSRLLKTTSKSAESPSNEEKEPFETSLSSGENQGEKAAAAALKSVEAPERPRR